MNINYKLKAIKLVRFGEILFDQQKRLILLCGSCQHHFLSFESFQMHLTKCIALKHIFSSIEKLQYDEEQKDLKLVNGKHELHIYEPYAVRVESNNYNFDWEADLKNSRWFMEGSQLMPIKQPYDIDTLYPTIVDDKPSIEQSSYADNQTTLINKHDNLEANSNIFAIPDKLKNNRYVMKNIAEEFWRLDAINPSDSMAASNPRADAEDVTSKPSTDVAKNDTQEILKKLRACGVIVKRRSTLGQLDNPALADAKKKLDLEMKKNFN